MNQDVFQYFWLNWSYSFLRNFLVALTRQPLYFLDPSCLLASINIHSMQLILQYDQPLCHLLSFSNVTWQYGIKDICSCYQDRFISHICNMILINHLNLNLFPCLILHLFTLSIYKNLLKQYITQCMHTYMMTRSIHQQLPPPSTYFLWYFFEVVKFITLSKHPFHSTLLF